MSDLKNPPPLLTTHLWLRTEPDTRTPITPEGAALLKKAPSPFVKITVEASLTRCFPDRDYAKVGCEIAPAGSWESAPAGTLIVGLSPIDDSKAAIKHHHLFYSHSFKDEAGWQDEFRRFLDADCVLYDYNFLSDEKNDASLIPAMDNSAEVSPIDASNKFSKELVALLVKFPHHKAFRNAEAAFNFRADTIRLDHHKRKVCLALDDSKFSDYALTWAMDNLIRRDDQVTVLTVFDFTPVAPLDIESTADVKQVNDALAQKGEKHSIKILRKAAKRLVRAGLRPRLMLLKGPVKSTIVSFLQGDEAQDVVVCASRGQGAVNRVFLGSVSDYLAHNLACTVIVVKESHDYLERVAAESAHDAHAPQVDDINVHQPPVSS